MSPPFEPVGLPLSQQIHDLPLRLYVRFNVALGRARSGMAGEHPHVPQRATYG